MIRIEHSLPLLTSLAFLKSTTVYLYLYLYLYMPGILKIHTPLTTPVSIAGNGTKPAMQGARFWNRTQTIPQYCTIANMYLFSTLVSQIYL